MSGRTVASSFIFDWASTPIQALALIFVWLCSGLSATANDELIRDSTPASWEEDAELTDVYFLNSKIGWAVGAQGTILRTTNGGQDWQAHGQAVPNQVAPEMGLQQKIRAMQQGQRTQLTGVADGSSDQARPFRCRFESVFFIDEKNGWVAGGYDVPYLNHSRGIILRTADGGVNWRQVKGALVPRLKRIRFSNPTHGWAVGDRGNLLPGSMFYTADGGETWSNQPIHKERSGPFDCIDGAATEHGFAAIDAEGQLIVAKNGQAEAAAIEGRNAARMNRLKMVDRQEGWCVGDGGAIWRSQNGGGSWSPLADDLNSPICQQMREFDWQALSISPSRIWIAGNPGSVLFSIDRTTGAVLSHGTGISAPVKGMHFLDDKHGWLVGSWGTILATTDGGQTWQRQRGRQRGVAILGIAFDERELPLEALAMYSNEDNWLMAVATCQGVLTTSAVQSIERLGAVGLYSIDAGDQTAAAKKKQDLQIERLVRLIRTLRPTVLLCNSEYRKQTDQGTNPISAFDPYLLISTAVQAAGDREAYPQQLEIAKLQPWTVDRVAYRAPAGELSLEPKRMLLRLGCLLEDRIGVSRTLLRLPLDAGEKTSYRLESASGLGIGNSTNLFNGLNRGADGADGAVPQRSSDYRPGTNRTAIELANRKHEKIAELAHFTANTEQDLIVWNQKMQEWLAPIDDSLAGTWLVQLAEKYLARGQIELCAKSLEYLVHRYRGHALRLPSLAWLVNYYSSDEFGRVELAHILRFRTTIAQNGDNVQQGARVGRPTSQAHVSHQDGQTILVWAPVSDKIELPKVDERKESPGREGNSGLLKGPEGQIAETVEASAVSGAAPPAQGVEVAAHSEAANSEAAHSEAAHSEAANSEPSTGFSADEIQGFLQSRWRRASSYMTQLNHADPDLVNQLSFRYLEANLKRKLSGKLSAESVFKRISLADEQKIGLSGAARAELELSTDNRAGLPSDTIRAPFTSERPHLDGLLDDPVWQSIQNRQLVLKRTPSEIAPPPRGWSDVAPQVKQDELMFAHDHQFLYVAIRCNKLAGQFYQMSSDARPRDPDLNRRDRVELYFDVDRDYQSAFKFTVDYRGWGAEELNGATGWNPQWFIARSEDESSWTVEMAIPMETFVAAPAGGQLSSDGAQMPAPTANSPEVAAIHQALWSLQLARVTTDTNLWNNQAKEQEKSELSKGLYQQILLEPAKFQFFAFQ